MTGDFQVQTREVDKVNPEPDILKCEYQVSSGAICPYFGEQNKNKAAGRNNPPAALYLEGIENIYFSTENVAVNCNFLSAVCASFTMRY